MKPHDTALVLAGAIGCLVAVVHGLLMERRIVRPLLKLVADNGRMAAAARRLLSPLLHLSTFAWLIGGIALIVAAIWLKQDGKVAIGALVGCLYLYGVVANAWATRASHPGWMLLAVAIGLILFALSGARG